MSESIAEHGIGLADMIKTLRSELQTAQSGDVKGIRFVAEKVELELQVELSRSDKVGGGIKFWVVSAEGGHEGAKNSTHTFKLTLVPIDAVTGGRVEVSSSSDEPAASN